MKPCPQIRKEPQGDCLTACVASLLEIPIDRIPDFAEQAKDLPPWGVVHMANEWLNQFGLTLLQIHLSPSMPWSPVPYGILCVLFGDTANGHPHAVVGRCDSESFISIHNPWPEAEMVNVSALGFIVPQDPYFPMMLGKSLTKVLGFAEKGSGLIYDTIKEECETALGINAPVLRFDMPRLNGKRAT